ncbi:hypothetical protein T4E_10660 [Trichinella pseudospiralis]|uniref:Uncharacterized protein n=1 Tax=Trichinella pseudospiralis TaxID=6337 RepID=A0A0V0XIU3_TRIPS|nr:hypothetical protein T4E_10660 [Trichinella pseudospiralis]
MVFRTANLLDRKVKSMMHNHWLKRYRKLANASSHTLVFATGSNIRLQVTRRSWGCGCTTIVSTTVYHSCLCVRIRNIQEFYPSIVNWKVDEVGSTKNQLLVAEQGFLHILLQEVESGDALVGDL